LLTHFIHQTTHHEMLSTALILLQQHNSGEIYIKNNYLMYSVRHY